MNAPHDHLRAWRIHVGMSQETLAKLAKADRSYLSKVESGRAAYTVRFLTRAAAGLGLDLNEMLRSMPGDGTEELLKVWTELEPGDRAAALELLQDYARTVRRLR